MKRSAQRRVPQRRSQAGAAMVEFAIVSLLLFTVVFGIVEMGRMLWTWNSAVEATRLGARLAAVCGLGAEATIKAAMQTRLADLQPAQVEIAYLRPSAADNTCSAATCTAVRVRLTDYTFQPLVPLIPLTVPMPAFSTTLRREAMSSSGKPACGA